MVTVKTAALLGLAIFIPAAIASAVDALSEDRVYLGTRDLEARNIVVDTLLGFLDGVGDTLTCTACMVRDLDNIPQRVEY